MKFEHCEQQIKSIKTFENSIIKLKVSKTFFHKNQLSATTPFNEQTKIKIKNLLNLNQKTKHLLCEPNMMIEILKAEDYYNIFFSKPEKIENSNPNSNNDIAIISKFAKLKSLIFFCKNIFQTYEQFWSTSQLYIFKKSALILVTQTKKENENKLSSLIAEFGATTEKGKFQEAIVKEHCKTIFASNAVEKIALID